MMPTHPLSELNQMDQCTFTTTLGAIFENTPTIAHRAWEKLPFDSLDHLHEVMVSIVLAMSNGEKLALICAHPSLGDRVKMAPASVREQAKLGLDCLPPEIYTRFQSLNQAYRERFGFPFIIAVGNHTIHSILEAFEFRRHNSVESELNQAIVEIAQIARFRLLDIIGDDHF
ncbi:MAG: 2-oxo-4-hydroxy-4-carboxy-5-ureidoimidazoline decarboxylase [Synechococcales bacterium]|nr:2-oxo-4-hydroxy-4-carboxy-5-ureidoimidazoline decarboxylase [Cyanobacteria bacterium REEB444]MEB3126138.1 2-oxo-4-hydroxy-4-carboxy-5-ureidoimidazoline decarboxylase [Synechococcales bacterium]